MGEFGDKFRKARESKDLTFDDVSNVTKISSRMLQAIEKEHFDQLPGGVFNKGFIRAYAKHLGLNDEEAVTDYLACLRQAQVDAQTWEPEPTKPSHPAPPNQRRVAASPKPVEKPPIPVQVEELPDLQLPRTQDIRQPRKNFGYHPAAEIPWRLVAVAAIVVVLGIFLWVRHSRAPRTQTAGAHAPVAQPAAPPAPVANASSTVPATQPPTPAPAQSPATSQPSPPKQPPQNQSVAQSQPTTLAAPTPAATTGEREQNDNDVTIQSFENPGLRSPKKSAASLALVIRATENTWISVLADGQLVTQETLIAPAHTSIHASREIVVRIGNAAGASFLFNGKDISPQGKEAEVKTLLFDSSGLKTVPSEPAPNQN